MTAAEALKALLAWEPSVCLCGAPTAPGYDTCGLGECEALR